MKWEGECELSESPALAEDHRERIFPYSKSARSESLFSAAEVVDVFIHKCGTEKAEQETIASAAKTHLIG